VGRRGGGIHIYKGKGKQNEEGGEERRGTNKTTTTHTIPKPNSGRKNPII
jgi:hypothetical protein